MLSSATPLRVLNVTDSQGEYAQQVFEQLREAGIRVELDVRNEKLGFKIREAQVAKIPYMLVIGDREVEDKTVTPRYRDGKNLEAMSVTDFISMVNKDCVDYK